MEFFEIVTTNGIRTVTITNPKKKNAINRPAYKALADILSTAAVDNHVKCVVLTGKGDFFSSGNDLTQNFEAPDDGTSVHQPMVDLVNAFIRFPKLLVAIINGPAIGITSTVIALCDIIYASEKAYFYTPFTNLGLCAEGCSSLTFPRILGQSKANEMLMLNHKMTAHEAYQFGFVAEVYKDVEKIHEKLKQIGELPIGSIMANKRLTRKFTIKELEAANQCEADELGERFQSEEAFMAVIRFQGMKKIKSNL